MMGSILRDNPACHAITLSYFVFVWCHGYIIKREIFVEVGDILVAVNKLCDLKDHSMYACTANPLLLFVAALAVARTLSSCHAQRLL